MVFVHLTTSAIERGGVTSACRDKLFFLVTIQGYSMMHSLTAGRRQAHCYLNADVCLLKMKKKFTPCHGVIGALTSCNLETLFIVSKGASAASLKCTNSNRTHGIV